MTPQDQHNPANRDNFDRLLAHRSEIAEFVNSFTAERVQRKAFEAVVCSLGLAEAEPNEAAPVEPLHIVKQEIEQEASDGEAAEPEAAASGRRRKARSGTKKSFTVTRGLKFAPDGHTTFEDFIAEKSPRNHHEKSLIAVYYLSEMMGISEVGIGDVLAAYQAAGWSAPAHPDTALRKAASETGWIDTGDSKAIKVVWKGENYVTTKMPVEAKKSS